MRQFFRLNIIKTYFSRVQVYGSGSKISRPDPRIWIQNFKTGFGKKWTRSETLISTARLFYNSFCYCRTKVSADRNILATMAQHYWYKSTLNLLLRRLVKSTIIWLFFLPYINICIYFLFSLTFLALTLNLN